MHRLKLIPVVLLLLLSAACGEAEVAPGSDPGGVNQEEEAEPLEDEGMGNDGPEEEAEVEGDSEEPAENTGEGAEENDDGY